MKTKYKKGDFITVPNKSQLEGLKPQVQTVFMYICSYSNEKGQCFPAIATIAEQAGISYSTASRAISNLEDLGFLKKVHQTYNGRQTSNLYQVMILEGKVTSDIPSGRSDIPTLPSDVPTPPVTDTYTPPSQIPTNKNHKNQIHLSKSNITSVFTRDDKFLENDQDFFPPKKDSASEKSSQFFSAFWLTYPRKVGKPMALKSWKTIMSQLNEEGQEELTARIILAVELYKKTEQWSNPAYIPFPSTFLNQKRYDDTGELKMKKTTGLNERLNEDMMKNPPQGVKVYKNIKK